MMFEGKHIHYSPQDNKPLCSYSSKICKQRRLSGYAFCIRHILEDKSAPFKQCMHVTRCNKQKCSNPIPQKEVREYCNSHLQMMGMVPKKDRKVKPEKAASHLQDDRKIEFAGRLCAMLSAGNNHVVNSDERGKHPVDPYEFPSFDVKSPTLEGVQSIGELLQQNICRPFRTHQESLVSSVQRQPFSELMQRLEAKSRAKLDRKIPRAASPTSGNIPKQTANWKTMNRLQSKIAQNKLLDKLRRHKDEQSNINETSLCSSVIDMPSIGDSAKPTYDLHPQNYFPHHQSWMPDSEVLPSSQIAFNAFGDSLGLDLSSANLGKLSMSELCKLGLGAAELQKLTQGKLNYGFQDAVPAFANQPKCSSVSSRMDGSHGNLHSSLLLPPPPPYPSPDVKPPPPYVEPLPLAGEINRKSAKCDTGSLSDLKTRNCVVKQECFADSLGSVSYRPKRKKKVCHSQYRFQNHPLLYDLYQFHNKKKNSKKIYLSTRVDSSDEDEEVRYLPWQRHWFLPSDDEEEEDAEVTASSHRKNYLELIGKHRLRQQRQVLSSMKLSRYERCMQHCELQSLLSATRMIPHKTGYVIRELQGTLPVQKKCKKCNLGLDKRLCCYENEEEKQRCRNVVLPYTRHCIKHIMYNVDQLIFSHCTAKTPEGFQCCLPAFDIKHEYPLCRDHMLSQEDEKQNEPKPKKPRKKTKPSALTRPPKKGKKKRNLQKIRPQESVDEGDTSRALENEVPNSSQSFSIVQSSCDVQKHEARLENMSMEDIAQSLDANLSQGFDAVLSQVDMDRNFSLPNMDAAQLEKTVSSLLQDSDFTDVLNKIPDEAFEEWGKNGEFVSKEAEEELERALVGSNADVSVVQDTLDKLSQENPSMSFDDDQNSPEITLSDNLLNSDSLDSETLPDSIHRDVDKLTEMASSGRLGIATAFNQSVSHTFPQSTSNLSSTAHNSVPSYSVNLLPTNHILNNAVQGVSVSNHRTFDAEQYHSVSHTSPDIIQNGVISPNGPSWTVTQVSQPQLPSFQNGFGGGIQRFRPGYSLPNIKTILHPQQLVPGITAPVTITSEPHQLLQESVFSNMSKRTSVHSASTGQTGLQQNLH